MGIIPKILIGTGNKGKIVEISSILKAADIEFATLADLNQTIADPEETGNSFSENALIKARAYARATNLSTASEDSGLEVTALAGFPGINSARWHQGDDATRCQALLDKLIDQTNRSAQFRTVVTLYNPATNESSFFSGILTGTIALTMSGTQGFGYDPIFIPDGQTQTIAQIGVVWKNTHSARSQAWQQLAQSLQ